MALLVSVFTGCSGRKDNNAEDTTRPPETTQASTQETKTMDKVKVVVYRAGNLQECQSDQIVKETVEKKFLDETGVNIDLDVQLISNDDFNTKVNLAISANDQLDAIYNYIGGPTDAGITSLIVKAGLVKPLDELIEKFGPNLKKQMPEAAWKFTTMNGTIMAIPSYGQESILGLLIRQDWLDELGLQVPKTLDDLEKVMEAFKKKGNNIVPLIGQPWEAERLILAGAVGTPTYFQFWVDPEDNMVKQAVFSPKYKEVLKYQYKWVKNGWFDKDNRTRPYESAINMFVSGQAGIWLGWSEVKYMIDSIVKPTLAANPNAKFAVLDAIAGPDGSSGFTKMAAASNGLAIFQKSKNAEYLVKYLDWMSASVDNYELAMHGVKGADWVEPKAGTWAYPEDKKEQYTKESPYIGRYALMQNVSLSNRINAGYTDEELSWMLAVPGFKTYTDTMEGISLPLVPEYKDKVQAVYDEYTNNVIAPATAGLADPYVTYDKYMPKLEEQLKGYFEIITKSYNEQKVK